MPHDPLSQDAIIHDTPRMSSDDRFTFRCDATLKCFTSCCRDVSIVLTPYDVLRLKRAVRVDSSEFLRRYTVLPFTREQKVPAVLIKMDPETRRCPFVTEQGCSVYKDRPWACRMYPLGVAEPRTPTPSDSRFHFLIRDANCDGHTCGESIAVRDWTSGQGIDEYDLMGRSFTELMLHDSWDTEASLEPDKLDMYFMACYDLDRFRRFVFESRFLALFDLDEARVDAMRSDDEELLDFAMQWLRFCLFGDKTMRVKPSVLDTHRAARTRVAQVPAGREAAGG